MPKRSFESILVGYAFVAWLLGYYAMWACFALWLILEIVTP